MAGVSPLADRFGAQHLPLSVAFAASAAPVRIHIAKRQLKSSGFRARKMRVRIPSGALIVATPSFAKSKIDSYAS